MPSQLRLPPAHTHTLSPTHTHTLTLTLKQTKTHAHTITLKPTYNIHSSDAETLYNLKFLAPAEAKFRDKLKDLIDRLSLPKPYTVNPKP